jgi:hypothetical protein
MTGHTRLYRRGATYYHRAAIPADIKVKCPWICRHLLDHIQPFDLSLICQVGES